MFTLASGDAVPVRMMSQFEHVPYVRTAAYQAAAIPYHGRQGRSFDMIVVLPTGALSELESTLDAAALADLTSSLSPRDVELEMPRFTMRSKLELSQALIAMGMPTAFANADLTGISDNPPPGNLQKVLHQGYIQLDEHGTEAAGATAVIAVDGSASIYDAPPPRLRLDRPFLVLIRHVQTGAVLFLGRLQDPSL